MCVRLSLCVKSVATLHDQTIRFEFEKYLRHFSRFVLIKATKIDCGTQEIAIKMKLLLVLSAFALFRCNNGQTTDAVYELTTTEAITTAAGVPEAITTTGAVGACSSCAEIAEDLQPKLSNVMKINWPPK